MTFENLIPYIVFGALLCAILGFFIYFGIKALRRFLTGSVKIIIPPQSYNFGDTVSGQITIIAKKQIQSNNVTISLVCEELQLSTDSKGQTHRRWREISRTDTLVSNNLTINAGTTTNLDFKQQIPAKSQSQTAQSDNAIVQGIVAIADRFARPRRWLLVAQVELANLTLSGDAKLNITQNAF